MNEVSLSGSDTLQINGRTITSVCDGDYADLKYPNAQVTMTTGKNGNAIYALDFRGNQGTFMLRLIRNSGDDRFLQSIQDTQNQDFASFILINGQFVKRVGDGKANVGNDTYKLQGGVINKRVEAKSNAQGETEQSLAIWELGFARAIRQML